MNYTYPMLVIRDTAGVFHRSGSWSDLFNEVIREVRDQRESGYQHELF